MKRNLVFFIGTVAELIKLFPVLDECRHRGLDFDIVLSGQNDIESSDLKDSIAPAKRRLVLGPPVKAKNAIELLTWFMATFCKGIFKLRKFLAGRPSLVVVHGDTVSTVLGAALARLSGAKVAHVEAGLRSFDLMNPFPEEIDRLIVSRLAHLHFCPGSWACSNLKGRSGVVDTLQNTLIDSLQAAEAAPFQSTTVKLPAPGIPYFVFVLHRQENLANENFVREMLAKVLAKTNTENCVFILHEPTRLTLERLGMLDEILKTPGLYAVPRLPYMTFMSVLTKARFILTDGGSNQEESYYLGQPCMILRRTTERREGLGENVVLLENDPSRIDNFLENPEVYRRVRVTPREQPSSIIAAQLEQWSAG